MGSYPFHIEYWLVGLGDRREECPSSPNSTFQLFVKAVGFGWFPKQNVVSSEVEVDLGTVWVPVGVSGQVVAPAGQD